MRRIRYMMAIPLFLLMIANSILENSKYERNRAPKENVRQASSIVKMWEKGFSASKLPGMPPSAGITLISKTLDSNADEEVKSEARELENRLTHNPAYVRFADRISVFLDDFERMRAAVIHGIKLPEAEGHAKVANFAPGFLVVTSRQHDSLHPDPQADVLMFEPDMIEALGDKVATSPTELKTLIALVFSRTEVGEYRIEENLEKGIKAKNFEVVKFPSYAHGCRAYVIDYATGKVTHFNEWFEADPETRHIDLLGSSMPSEPDGYSRLRERVREWIHEQASASRSANHEIDE